MPHVGVARVSQIWRRSRWAVFLYLVLFLPLGLGTSLASDHPFVFGSAAGLFLLAGLFRWGTLLHGGPPARPEVAATWLRCYGRQTAACGLLWGLFAGWVQIAYHGATLQYLILLISVGIACFTLGAFAGDRRHALRFLYCLLGPAMAGVAWAADREAMVLLALLSLFLATITLQTFEIDDWFVRSTVESLLLERARKEAEDATRVKSEFLANMSHELRTPMNGVMGMLELLQQSELDREQKLLVRTSHRSAEALLDILNDILDFSKMSAGKLDFLPKDFQLRNAIEDVYGLLGPRAFDKGVDLGYRLDPAIPDWLCGDEGRLRQVLMNLVSNAIKFSVGGPWPGGGSVFVEANLLNRDFGAVSIRFTVADTGVGMSQGTLSKLFQPFMQADTSTSRRFGGTGLGLAISRQLVAAMGGAITAESEEGQGTKFTFDIQLAPAMVSHTRIPPLADCRVLLLEPAACSRRTIAYLVSRLGAATQQVDTVGEAAAALATGPWHCVIAGANSIEDVPGLREELLRDLKEPHPPLFFLHHSGETVDGQAPGAFTLTRPVRAAQVAEALVLADCLPRRTVPAPVLTPIRLSGRVLVVEDNLVNQMLAQRLLHVLGLTSQVAANGSAALEILRTESFGVILMDCQMPGMDGYEATRRLRLEEETRHLPIIAMTANAMKGDRELCLAAGMNDYLAKPIRLDRLREALSRYLPAGGPVPGPESSR
ncbi:MAG TPA: ATP-binding protein [Bryobacteraceae bacterium]|nr:ATP-binding protein [Bryobacteraceae bacterium]